MKSFAWFFLAFVIQAAPYSFADTQSQPEPLNQNSSSLDANTFVTVSGKKLPTKLWGLVNGERYKRNPVDWNLLKNGTISYKNITPRVLKIEFRFNTPVNNMYMFFLSSYAGCIGSYVISPKDFQAFVLGMGTTLHSASQGSDSSIAFDLYLTGLNSNDDIDALSGEESIKWLVDEGKLDIGKARVVSANMARICPETVDPSYLNNEWLGSPAAPKISLPANVSKSSNEEKIDTAIPLATNTFVTIDDRKLPTRLWAWVNEDAFKRDPDWDIVKNGVLSFEPVSPRGIKITIRFDRRVSRDFMLGVGKRPWFEGCIANYLFPLGAYEANTLGHDKYLPPDLGRSKDGLEETWFSIGVNSSDDINAIITDQPVQWMNLGGYSVDTDALQETSANLAKRCLAFMNPAYVDQDRAVLGAKFEALPNVCPNGTVRIFKTIGDREKEIVDVTNWVKSNETVIQNTSDIQSIRLGTTFGSPERPFRYVFGVGGKNQTVYAVVNADRLCNKPRFSLMCIANKNSVKDPYFFTDVCKQQE